MLRGEIIHEIVALLCVPAMETPEGRSVLLFDIGGHDKFHRTQNNCQLDLVQIVQYVASHQWLEQFTMNAKPWVADFDRFSTLVEQLKNASQSVRDGHRNHVSPLAHQLSQSAKLAREIVALHRFDLEPVVHECAARIRTHPGLVGLVVNCACDDFGELLALRLKEDLFAGSRDIEIGKFYVDGIRLGTTAKRIRELRTILRLKNAIFTARVSDNTEVPALWSAVSEAFDTDCPRRFVLIVVTSDLVPPPPGMYALAPPVFLRFQMRDWWTNVIDRKGWFRRRSDLLAAYASDLHAALDMSTVYSELRHAIERLQEHRDDEEQFYAAWTEWRKMIYAHHD